MEIRKAVEFYIDYHSGHSRPNTLKSYQPTLRKFAGAFPARDVASIAPEEILSYLTQLTQKAKPLTKRSRYTQLRAFFNFVANSLVPGMSNPCDTVILKKSFRPASPPQWRIPEKEVVDELIFRTTKPRNRLILELMARGGMRIGEVLHLTSADVEDRKLTLNEPKSGRGREVAFIPRKVAQRLKEYVQEKRMGPADRIFPLSYTAARLMTRKAGRMVGFDLRPHDLRRHAATYASRSGVPIEIVSKVILRHANLSTTQRYLGKVSDMEAMRWIENLYG